MRIDYTRSVARTATLVKPILGACLFGCVLVSTADAAYAHGALIELTQGEIDLTATFDTGEPMSGAQVLIYAPTDPETPWATGQTNDNGQFSFTPEADEPGLWEVTVRKAGHGHTTTFAVGESAQGSQSNLLGSSSVGTSSESPSAQRWLSMVAVVWGFVGTALFFARKKHPTETQSPEAQTSKIPSSMAEESTVSGGQR